MVWEDPETGEKHSIYPTNEYRRDLELWSKAGCAHAAAELRWALDRSNRKALRRQCLTCGLLVGPALRQSEAPPNIPNADTEKLPNYQRSRRDAFDGLHRKHHAIQQKAKTDFQGQHAAYLRSDIWRAKRAKVLKRAGGLCEGCLENPASEVHHLSYAHHGDELLYELVALCPSCHRKAHPEDAELDGEGEWEEESWEELEEADVE